MLNQSLMAHSLKYYLALCLFFTSFHSLIGQVSPDSLHKMIYEFDKAVIVNDSKIIQSLGPELVDLLPSIKSSDDQILIWLINSKLNIHLGDLEKGQECIDKAESIYKSHQSNISLNTIAKVFSGKSLFATFNRDPVNQETNLDTCLMILSQAEKPNHYDIASAYQKLCYIYYGKGQVLKSIDLMEQAEIQMKKLMVEGDVELVKERKVNQLDSLLMANIFNDIAFLSGSLGNNDKVIPYYRNALLYNPDSWNIKLSLVNNLREEGDHKTANQITIDLIDKTDEDRPDILARAMHAMITNIGTSEDYLYENPEEEMIAYYSKIKELQNLLPETEYPYDAGAAGILCDYFRRVAKKKDRTKAKYYLDEAQSLINERDNMQQTANIFIFQVNNKSRQAQLDWIAKDYESAEKAFKEIIADFTGKENPNDDEIKSMMLQKEYFKDLLIDYVRMDLQRGTDTQDGHKFFEKANRNYLLIDSVVDSLLSFNETKIDSDPIQELHKIGFGLSIKQFEQSNDEQYLHEAYKRFEKLSSLTSYRHHIRTSLKYSNEKDTKLKHQKNSLREEMDILEGIVSEDETEQANINEALDSLTKLFISVSESLSDATNSFKSQIEKNKAASLYKLQQSISSDELYYHLVMDRISDEVYILLVSSDQIKTKVLQVHDLNFKIEQVLNALSDPASNNYHALLKNLYSQFIDPFENLVKSKKLVFVPGPNTALLPFDLMMDNKGQYLGIKNPVLYKYSSSWKSEQENKIAGDEFIAFASSNTNKTDSTIKSDFLTAAKQEVKMLSERFGARVLKSEKNPKTNLLYRSKNARLLHLAVHSNLEPLNPIKSSLVLAENGDKENDLLYYHEIDDLELNSDLVLLSSCESGLDFKRSAGTVPSLARAFQLAGAKNLIQTKWSINDESTSILMGHFYSKLNDGESISSSLSLAKKEFLAEAPNKWQHPYYWGAFVLNGEDGFIELSKSSIWQSSTIGIVGIMSMLFLFIFAKSTTKINST